MNLNVSKAKTQRQTYQTSERRGHHIVTILGEEKAENVTAGKIYGKRYRKRQQKNMLCRISALHTKIAPLHTKHFSIWTVITICDHKMQRSKNVCEKYETVPFCLPEGQE